MVLKKELSREQLYELVWSKPMRDAAADVGISDVGLKKRCRSQAVPVPPQGYWNKVHAGHRMPPRPPLPAQAAPPTQEPSPGQGRRPQLAKQYPLATGSSFTEIRAQREGRTQRAAKGAPSPKRNFRRRGRGAPRYAYEHYSLSIERWDWNYSFGINPWKRHISGAYIDHRALKVYGPLLQPAAVTGLQMEVLFLPANMHARSIEPPADIGEMFKVRGEQRYEAHLFFPNDVLPSLLPMLIANKLRVLTLDGMVLFRGRTDIRSFNFDATAYWEDDVAV